MSSKIRPAALAVSVAALLTAACATSSTTFVSTWRNPAARPVEPAGRKVVALFMGQNATTKRIAEDAMARELVEQGAEGVPAYAVLGPDARDEEAVRNTLRERGFDGVVVMRVVGQESQYRYEHDYWGRYPHYRRLWGGGYWGWGWRHVYDPGYLVQDRIVSVETLVYSLAQGDLLWAGVSRTFNPENIDQIVAEVAHGATGEMSRAGLIARGPAAAR